jgi:hypothetical protein
MEMSQSTAYNENTYIEYHLFLCELLTRFQDELNHLDKIQDAQYEEFINA